MKNNLKYYAADRIISLFFVSGLACALVSLIALLPSALAVEALSVTTQPETPPKTTIGINGPPPPILAGEEISTTIRIEDVMGLYGAEINLSFVPEDLQVVDADGGTTGVQITPGDCPLPDFIVSNSANNVNGTIFYAVTELNPSQPIDGSCDVAHITFATLRVNDTTVSFGEVILSDSDGQSIPLDIEDWNISTESMYLPVALK